jgi:tetratricopeptide (TPR) repeat protein
VHLRCGDAAERLGLLNEAFKCYLVATSFNDHSYKPFYGLGNVEFKRENYEKAIGHLTKARSLNPDFAPALCVLGHANFKLKKYKEAMINIRRALEIVPGDKETLFTLAECYAEAGQSDQALRIYSHLRADPDFGPDACLKSGMIHNHSNRIDNAVTDFEIGLKHAKIKPEALLELKYQLGSLYIKKNDIPKAIQYLKEIQADKPEGYKQTALLISQYADLSTNQNLQIYVMAQPAEFLALCRKIVMTFYPKTRVKITQTNVEGQDWADILAEIDTVKWSDVIGFRFVRTQGNIGELVVRDFHAHLKDVKAGKGICFGIGTFTDEAKRFTEARLIELVEKPRLSEILSHVDTLARAALDAKKDTETRR